MGINFRMRSVSMKNSRKEMSLPRSDSRRRWSKGWSRCFRLADRRHESGRVFDHWISPPWVTSTPRLMEETDYCFLSFHRENSPEMHPLGLLFKMCFITGRSFRVPANGWNGSSPRSFEYWKTIVSISSLAYPWHIGRGSHPMTIDRLRTGNQHVSERLFAIRLFDCRALPL